MRQTVINGQRDDVDISPKLELVTTYHMWFVMKLLWKCYVHNIFITNLIRQTVIGG